MGEDAALQIIAKGLADIPLGGVQVALPIELTRAGQLEPDLEMFGYCFSSRLRKFYGGYKPK
jgi:hypothetical protein